MEHIQKPAKRKTGTAKAEEISHCSWGYSSIGTRNCSSKKLQLERKGYFNLPNWQAGRRCTVCTFKKAEEVRWDARTFLLEQAENLGERRIMGSLSSSFWKGLSPHLWFSQGTLLLFQSYPNLSIRVKSHPSQLKFFLKAKAKGNREGVFLPANL